jgi:hypothetical protein
VADHRPVAIDWSAETCHDTAAQFQIRRADTAELLNEAPWSGPAGETTWWTSPGAMSGVPPGGYFQYRARLITPNGAGTPYLDRVTLHFEK